MCPEVGSGTGVEYFDYPARRTKVAGWLVDHTGNSPHCVHKVHVREERGAIAGAQPREVGPSNLSFEGSDVFESDSLVNLKICFCC